MLVKLIIVTLLMQLIELLTLDTDIMETGKIMEQVVPSAFNVEDDVGGSGINSFESDLYSVYISD